MFNQIKINKYIFDFHSLLNDDIPSILWFRLASCEWDNIFISNPLFTKKECHEMIINQIEDKFYERFYQMLVDDYDNVESNVINKRTHEVSDVEDKL